MRKDWVAPVWRGHSCPRRPLRSARLSRPLRPFSALFAVKGFAASFVPSEEPDIPQSSVPSVSSMVSALPK